MSEQPDVPELPVIDATTAPFLSEEEEILNAVEEDAVSASAPAAPDVTTAAMLRIAQSMEKMMARQDEVRQIPYNEIKPVSPWNPEGKRERLRFARPTYMHGIPLSEMRHTEEEIGLFNQLKPGRYVERKVEVQRGQDGAVNIQWPGVRVDQRIEFYSRFGTITDLLKAVIAERALKEAKKKRGEFDPDETL